MAIKFIGLDLGKTVGAIELENDIIKCTKIIQNMAEVISYLNDISCCAIAIVGYPSLLSGNQSATTKNLIHYSNLLKKHTKTPIIL